MSVAIHTPAGTGQSVLMLGTDVVTTLIAGASAETTSRSSKPVASVAAARARTPTPGARASTCSRANWPSSSSAMGAWRT